MALHEKTKAKAGCLQRLFGMKRPSCCSATKKPSCCNAQIEELPEEAEAPKDEGQRQKTS